MSVTSPMDVIGLVGAGLGLLLALVAFLLVAEDDLPLLRKAWSTD